MPVVNRVRLELTMQPKIFKALAKFAKAENTARTRIIEEAVYRFLVDEKAIQK